MTRSRASSRYPRRVPGDGLVDQHRYRWTILAVGVVAQASFSAVFFGLPVLAPALRSEYGLTLAELGVVLASVNIGCLATVLPWGALADRIGERPVIATGLGAAAAALVLAAYAPGFASLVVALVAAGAFGASVQAASGRAVMSWFDPAQRGLALGIRQTAVPLGGALAALALPAVAATGGVEAALLALAVFSVAGAVAGAGWLRDAPVEPSAAELEVAVFRDARLWRLCAGSGLLIVAQTSILGFLVLFLHEERGFSTGAAGGVLAGIQIAGAVLRVASGRWSDRARARIAPLLRLGLALAAALTLSAALVRAPSALLLPVLVVAGSLSLSWNSLSFTAAAELAGRARSGAALGFQQASLSLAGAITPIVFAGIVAATSWTVGFALAAAVALLGTAVLRDLAREPALRHAPA